jgi:hypothetical protein
MRVCLGHLFLRRCEIRFSEQRYNITCFLSILHCCCPSEHDVGTSWQLLRLTLRGIIPHTHLPIATVSILIQIFHYCFLLVVSIRSGTVSCQVSRSRYDPMPKSSGSFTYVYHFTQWQRSRMHPALSVTRPYPSGCCRLP